MQLSRIIGIGFAAGVVAASVSSALWLVASGARPDARVECTLTAVRALPEDPTLATARDSAVLIGRVKACALVDKQ